METLFDAIPKEEFALPSQPAALDEVRKKMTTRVGSITVANGQKPKVGCHVVIGG